MSFSTTFDLTTLVDRGVLMLKANEELRNTTTPADSLVTDVLAQEAPIEQSPNKSIIPIIYVYLSKNPIRQVDNFGRSSLDVAGAKYYHLEFYNVIIARGISKQDAQVKVQNIGKVVRDVYQKNLRMAVPPNNTSSPLAAENEVISVPYVLRSTDPNIQAINVIVRPNVPIDLV